uniref:Uncharacterized protein n=1 Tax=Tanacetum cinerariifolium TaxID=118510 RepID=A0A699J534_TANCI|nr:hypothetical protein [Tanacetum cinerariifolium]
MTHLVASLTLDSAKSCVMQGASCTQRRVSMAPFVISILFVLSWGGIISLDSFLPSIMLLVVIVVTVIIVAVILIFVVVSIIGVVIIVTIIGVVIVVVVGGIPSIIKLLFMIIDSFSCYLSFTWPSVPIGMKILDDEPGYPQLLFPEMIISIRLIRFLEVKERHEKDKIGSKPDKNGKRGEARKCQKQSQLIKQEKMEKIQVE